MIRVNQRQKNLISILQLGTIDYATGLHLQQKLVALRKESRIGDVVVLLEHTPVITLGRNAKAGNVIAPKEVLARRGIEVFECDRGGDVTFHGPGQLVGYPIFDLRGFPSTAANRKSLGAVDFVRRLEEVLIRACAEFRIATNRVAGLTGVWTSGTDSTDSNANVGTGALVHSVEQSSTGLEAKIAALGIHISRGVTSHGIALNVNTDLSFFNLIVPCGITSKPVTSMQKELGRALAVQDVAHALSRSFGSVFQSQILWLDTLDALLGTNRSVSPQVPEVRAIRGEAGTNWPGTELIG